MINSQQVVSNGRLVSHFEKFDPNSYRILERPLSQLLIDDLIAGSWTIEEFVSKYGIDKQDIRNVLNPLMDDASVFEEGYIPRRIIPNDQNGHRTRYRYSFIPIPIQARIFDPSLGFSLLKWSDILQDEDIPISAPYEVKKEDYFQNLTSYWGIPEDKILNHFNSEKTLFVNTVYGPLPVLSNPILYQQILDKFTQSTETLAQKSYKRIFSTEYRYYWAFLNQGPGSITDLRYCVVKLHDILEYCREHTLVQEYRRFQEINRNLLKMITLNPKMTSLPPAERAQKTTKWTQKIQKTEFNKDLQQQTLQTISDPIIAPKNCDDNMDPNPLIHSIISSLHSSDLKVKIEAIEQLSNLKTDEALNLLHQEVFRCNQAFAVYATECISTFPLSRTPEVLADILHSVPHPKARATAAQALSGLNTQASVMALGKGLSDYNTQVREACVRSLGIIGGPLAIKILKNHMETENSVVVREAIERILKQ